MKQALIEVEWLSQDVLLLSPEVGA